MNEYVIQQTPSLAIAALTAAFSNFGVERSWRPANHARLPFRRRFGARKARGPLPPPGRDPMAELARLDGKLFRHSTTGEIRELDNCPQVGRVGFILAKRTRRGSYYVESTPRKALAWIRNAVEVRS